MFIRVKRVELPIASPRSMSCDTMAAFQKKSVPGTITTGWILDSSGWIPDSMSWILDSKLVDSGFHRLKLPGFWIPDYLTLGEFHNVNRSGYIYICV